MNDFFAFRRMLTPWILRISYIVGIILTTIVGIYDIVSQHEILLGIMVIILSPIFLRVALEFIMVYFILNETLTDIRSLLKEKASEKS